MYILVDSNLKMTKGKIAAQVGHVVQQITETIIVNYYEKHADPRNESHMLTYDNYKNWNSQGSAKIVLRATHEELENIILSHGNQIKYIRDAGLTQVAPNSLTVVAFIPMKTHKMTYNISQHKLL